MGITSGAGTAYLSETPEFTFLILFYFIYLEGGVVLLNF